MFATLTEELLDLTAREKGVGLAAYAASDEGGGGCSSACSIIVCCFLCKICW